MRKFKLYLDKDAETVWLNEMAAEGWAMKSFFAGLYNFEKCEKGEYTYQVDFGNKFFAVSDDYREFMEDAGVEIVQPWGFWVILRKRASEGEFTLYTDVDSSIEHYSKILRMFKAAAVVELLCLFVEIYGAVIGSRWGLVFAFVIGAMLLALLNMVVKTRNIIAEFKERRDGVPDEKCNRQISPLLAAGMLLNGCALAVSESISGHLKMTLQIAAIILMLAGLYYTCLKKRH